MRRDSNGRLVYSPTDLVRFHASAFASWMDRHQFERPGVFEPDPESEEDRIVADLGIAHEAAYLAKLRSDGKSVIEIKGRDEGAVGRTRTAIEAGPDIVFQAALQLDSFAGYADFLERVPKPSRLGNFQYEISDTKLASTEKPSYLLQLCAYAEMLEALQGERPERVTVILRGNERKTFRTDDFYFVYRAVKRAFLLAMASFDPDRPPEPDLGGDWGRWTTEARRRLAEVDSLALVAGMRADHVRKFRAHGIHTVAELARTSAKKVPHLSQPIFERLHDQAALQFESRGKPLPTFRVLPTTADDPRHGLALLPPPSPLDVYFDMEGYPLVEGGLEYLFGAATNARSEPDYVDWWAHDADEERRAFEAFVGWVVERRRRDPGMHVYHYAAYERSALRRLMGRYGVCEAEIDELLRGNVLVDLYAVVRQGVRVGTPSYSLKALEVLYGRKREGEVQNAAASIVAYHRYMESGEGRLPATSPQLARIRDYNRDDCHSTRELLAWLRERQAEKGIAWAPPESDSGPVAGSAPIVMSPAASRTAARREAARRVAEALRASIPEDAAVRADESDRWRVTELLGQLVEFHRREEKPLWWSLFERDEMDEDQRHDDPTCLAGLVREPGPLVAIARSKGAWYGFDSVQETKAREGSNGRLAGFVDVSCSIEEFDETNGRALLKFGATALAKLSGGEPPSHTAFLIHDYIGAGVIEDSLLATATAWQTTGRTRPAIRDLLLRRAPCITGHEQGPLMKVGEDPVAATVRLVRSLSESVLCVQGPPGTGKTYTAARVIAALVKEGRTVGVTSNSHKAILNLLGECAHAIGRDFRCLKVGTKNDDDDAFAAVHPGATLADSAKAAGLVATHRLIGATAWFFSRPDVADTIDVLFIDEAGQVTLADLVGMAPSSKSLVLLGDPMQLPHPMQGSHPGDSGLSCLEHVLKGHGTVPPELGVFLPTTQRLHPSLCTFISGAFYEDRLLSTPEAAKRIVRVPDRIRTTGGPLELVSIDAGLVFLPVPHDGNGQRSDEEVEAIVALVRALVGREVTDSQGRDAGTVRPHDILVVAPYNVQVRALERRLPPGVRVGTVDRFQGQEARVAIVSLTASDGEAAARGLDFVLDRRRLNVAISRAQSLAIVVASPSLVRARCTNVDQMRLVNTLCRIVEAGAAPPATSSG